MVCRFRAPSSFGAPWYSESLETALCHSQHLERLRAPAFEGRRPTAFGSLVSMSGFNLSGKHLNHTFPKAHSGDVVFADVMMSRSYETFAGHMLAYNAELWMAPGFGRQYRSFFISQLPPQFCLNPWYLKMR